MGFLSRFEKKAPSTADDPAAINTAARLEQDPEKHEISQLEGPNGNGAPYHVTPEMEKQVLRKLDSRLIPLVMILCTAPNPPYMPKKEMLMLASRSPSLFGSIKHWVRLPSSSFSESLTKN
jgi:hypothetical protein